MTIDEVKAKAREFHGQEISDELAQRYIDTQKSGALADKDLDGVAGGLINFEDFRLQNMPQSDEPVMRDLLYRAPDRSGKGTLLSGGPMGGGTIV